MYKLDIRPRGNKMAIIGIDLGTTNSLAALWRNGEPTIIPNANGGRLTPSVVSVDDDGTILVGDAAKERLITSPDKTASCFKRTMGQRRFYMLGDKAFNSVELSSLILKSLKTDAEKFLNEEIEEAVISVPAYFNQNQRKATKDAAKLAGLKVERLVSEPTAAALCHGVQNKDDFSTVMVLDLGGGTFDVSLLELFDGVVDVKAVSGDNMLGGEDFTRQIATWFLEECGIKENPTPEELNRLVKLSENAKRTVTDEDDQPGFFVMKIEIGGKEHKQVLTYEKFSEICKSFMSRMIVPIKKVLRDTEMKAGDIDGVILMGGATRMKNVRDFAKDVFGEKVITSYNPDETVGLGAAILAAMKANDFDLQETVLTDICPFTLGIAATMNASEEPSFSPIIERNSPVPISIVKKYSTVVPGQTKVNVKVYQGESFDLDKNLRLGVLEVPVPHNLSSTEEISVRFTYDINGLLEIETTTSDGIKKSMMLNQNNADLSEEEIALAQKKMQSLKILPWEESVNKLLLERGKRLFSENLGEVREKIALAIEDFKKALDSQNPDRIKTVRNAVKTFFDKIDDIGGEI